MITRLITRSLAVAGACAALAAPAQAQTIIGPIGAGGDPFDLTNVVALLVSAHPGENLPFIDTYSFAVTAPSLGVATIILPSPNLQLELPDLATITGLALITAEGVTLASDTDGNDGFTVLSALPAPGFYGLLVVGQSGGGNGAYLGALGSVPLPPVPEPAPAALLAAGLASLAWLRARRRDPA